MTKRSDSAPRHEVSEYRRIVNGKVQTVRRYERTNRGSPSAVKDQSAEPGVELDAAPPKPRGLLDRSQ